jgi:hypothetical protein
VNADRQGHWFQYLMIRDEDENWCLARICPGCGRHEEKIWDATWLVIEEGDGFCQPLGGKEQG